MIHVHQHVSETAYAVDPKNPDHILAPTRIQRHALPGEDPEAVKKITGVPYPASIPWCYKNGLLLDSTDGGRTFREVPDGLFGFGSYRWSTVWTKDNLVVLVSLAGQEPGELSCDATHIARVSPDGGQTWVDGTPSGTGAPNKAKKFALVPVRPDGDYSDSMAATVKVASNRFMTAFRYKKDRTLKGIFWHLKNLP